MTDAPGGFDRQEINRITGDTTGDYAIARLEAEIAYQLGRIADTLDRSTQLHNPERTNPCPT